MSKRKRKRKPTGKKCIYFAHCGNEADSVEHAIPENLMPPGSHEILLEEHICEECNNGICATLDEQVIRQSYVGWIHEDFETFEGRGSSSFYRKFHHNYPPLRFLGVFKSNRLALLEPKDFMLEENLLMKKAAVPMPSHLIVTRHNNGDSFADILDKSSDFCYSEKDVHRVDQNRIVVFGPVALKGYYDEAEECYKPGYYHNPDEFIREFLDPVPSGNLQGIYVPPDPDDPDDPDGSVCRAADNFMVFLENRGLKSVPLDKSDLQIKDVMLLSPDTSRGIAKIAFHCFLYTYRTRYDGREEIFDEIKDFIYNGNCNKVLVDEFPALGERAAMRPGSDERCYIEHIFSSWQNDQNIVCISEFYVGTLESLLFTVILAGCDENKLEMYPLERLLRVPYEVSRENPRIKRIIHPTCEETDAVSDGTYPGNPQTKRIILPSDIDIDLAEASRSNSFYERLRRRLRRR